MMYDGDMLHESKMNTISHRVDIIGLGFSSDGSSEAPLENLR